MKDLVKRAMHKDAKAFVDLMQYHMQSMYKVARSFLRNDDDIADAIQETILTCFEKLDTLKEPKYFKTWMTRILINHCKDILKNNFPRRILPIPRLFGCQWKIWNSMSCWIRWMRNTKPYLSFTMWKVLK